MSFLFPVFLLGALAIALPVILHLLRRDVAPEVPFTAVRLLRNSPIERSRRRRLRDLLLLAARIAALVLLAAAFARPYTPGAAASSSRLRIIAVDRSFSMDAPGRFQRALDLAGAALAEAGFAEQVAVIAFDERAEVVARPGGTGEARAALALLAPSKRGTRYASLLDTASEIASGGPARLVIVTDLQRAGWEGETSARTPASLTLDIRDVGPPSSNLAVTGLRVDDTGVVAAVRNASSVTRPGTLVVAHGGASGDRVPFSAPPQSLVELRLQAPSAARSISATLDDPGGFPADNSRHLVIGAGDVASVMVIASGDASGFFLLRALEAAAESLDARTFTAAEIAGERAKVVAAQAAVVLLSTRGLDRSSRDAIVSFVRKGGGLLVAAAPEVDPAVLAAMFAWEAAAFGIDPSPRQVALTATDLRHPMFRAFAGLSANLGQVVFEQAWRVGSDGWQVPARFSDGSAAVLERSEGIGKVVLFASDLDRRWNDFPLHPAFVPFVVEAARYLSARRAHASEFVVGRVPPGVDDEPGIHRLADGREVAVNVDTRESSTAAMSTSEFAAMVDAVPQSPHRPHDRASAEQAEAHQNLWQYGLMLMLVALIAECLVGRT